VTAIADTLDLPLTPPPGGQVLYKSARATIIWGDCRDAQVIARAPAGYGLLATDPPYGVNYRSRRGQNFDLIEGDDGSVDWPAVLAQWAGPEGTSNRGLANNRHVYVFGYQPEDLEGPLRLGATADMVWDKAMTGMGDLTLPWGPAHERFVFGVHVKARAGRDAGGGRLSARLRQGSVIRYPRPNASGVTRHSTEKPWQLMAQLVESSTVRGDLVVDPCGGSGSTAVAAVLEGRRAFTVEIDRRNVELIVERVQAAERIVDQIAKC
jgi:hypothetical protein